MLDSKASSTISMAGTIATLFMGFGSFLLTRIEPSKYDILIPASVILMIEVILSTITIKYSMDSYKLQNYKYVMGAEHFFDSEHGNGFRNCGYLCENRFPYPGP